MLLRKDGLEWDGMSVMCGINVTQGRPQDDGQPWVWAENVLWWRGIKICLRKAGKLRQ